MEIGLMTRLFALPLACVAAFVLVFSSGWAGAETAPDLAAPGKLTYGVAASFAPFEFQKDGAFTGFDIELGEAIAAKMKLSPSPLNMDFKGLIPALQGKRIDVINSAMYINPQRAEQVEFIPYMRIGNEILVRKGNPLKIAARSDLCGHRVAVTLGAIEETYARQDTEACSKAGKPEVVIMTLPTAQDSALSLAQGRADAMFDSTPGAVQLVTERPESFEIAGAPFESNTQIGIAVRKGDAAMKAAVQAALKEVVADGTYAKLLAKYHLPAEGSLF
jgi:polar amino acid transport system substrate-binding protein